MTTLLAYTLGTDGLSLSTYALDLATGEETTPRIETFRSPKTRRSRAATLSETHTDSARIERHPSKHAVCFLVREPALDEWALYFRGQFAGLVMGHAAAVAALDAMVYDWLEEAQALAALEAAAEERDAEERDAEEAMAALHPRYVARGGDVVDTGAGRWYCTLTAWPYSPAARDGAVLGRAAA